METLKETILGYRHGCAVKLYTGGAYRVEYKGEVRSYDTIEELMAYVKEKFNLEVETE